jgi:3-oxoacyl-[acyl-carrier protein] reductase
MDLTNKCALVTGASRGIGRAVAVALAKAGADVAINYAGDAEAAKQTEELCAAYGVNTLVIKADVANAEECKAMMEQVKAHFGKLDILVNNAGITKDKLMIGMDESDFMDVINTNLKGSFLCMQLASKLMMKQRYGRIINMSSVVGLHGNASGITFPEGSYAADSCRGQEVEPKSLYESQLKARLGYVPSWLLSLK